MSRLLPSFLLLGICAGCFGDPKPAMQRESGGSPKTADQRLEAVSARPKTHVDPAVKRASHLVPAPTVAAPALESEPAGDEEDAFARQLAKLVAAATQQEGKSKFDTAEETRREILELLERRYGESSWQALNARLALAHTRRLAELTFDERGKLLAIGESERWSASLAAHGELPLALEEAQRAVELTREVWGDDYYLTANRLFDEAQIQHALRDHEAAEDLFLKTLDLRRKTLGREHPDYVAVLSALAAHYQSKGQFDQAEKMLREAVGLDRSLWGDRHPTYAMQLNNLGMLVFARGKHEAAVQTLTESADIRREALGAEHVLYAHSLYNLGSVRYAAGDHHAAAPHFESALPIFERELGPAHQMTLLTKNNLAMVELARKNLTQAEFLLVEVEEAVAEASGQDSPAYAAALAQLAIVHSHQTRYADADKLLAQAQAIQERALGVDHPTVAKTVETRVTILRRDNRAAEADRLLARAKKVAPPSAGQERP